MEQFLRTTLNCDMSRTERGTVCVCVCANEQASKHFVCVCVCVRLPGVEQRCTFRIEGRDTPQPQGIIMQCKYAWCKGGIPPSRYSAAIYRREGYPPAATRARRPGCQIIFYFRKAIIFGLVLEAHVDALLSRITAHQRMRGPP
jgi:hypothetical protein